MSAPKEKPAPLLTPDIDISGLEYMPLFITRLRRSKLWLRTRRQPELFRPAFAMWMRAYQERPAGSLEADDDVLADAAELGFEAWIEHKQDLLLGWTLCSDGRYYHGVLCEIVRQGYEKVVLPNLLRTKAATEARLAKMRNKNVTSTSRERDVNASHTSRAPGREEGRKEGKNTPPKNGASHHHNGNTPRDAMLNVDACRRSGTVPTDPITVRVIEAMGGWQAISTKTDAAWRDLITDFEARYRTEAARH